MTCLPTVCQAAEQRAEVLVYYANETAPEGQEDTNYQTVTRWLRSGEDPAHGRIAEQLTRDRRDFAAVVDTEVDALIVGIPRLPRGPATIILTNRLVRRGKCLLWRHGRTQFEEVGLAVPNDDNYILAANPLSRPQTMRDVLRFAAREFPPARHAFVLVTKSHGSSGKALTPRLAVRAEDTSRDELLRIASGQLGEQNLPVWAGRMGVSKDEYLSILSDAGRELKMYFALVYLEACNAHTSTMTADRLPDNVDG